MNNAVNEHRLSLALEELRCATETANRLRRDRDTLLATLEECVKYSMKYHTFAEYEAMLERARIAIAQAKQP